MFQKNKFDSRSFQNRENIIVCQIQVSCDISQIYIGGGYPGYQRISLACSRQKHFVSCGRWNGNPQQHSSAHRILRGFSQKYWVGVSSLLSKTLTLFVNKICDFPPEGYPQKSWVGCMAHFPKPLPYL